MRTKTLLLTAAALAAGLFSSFAQSSNVYSVNVVGYINVTVPGGVNGGYFFMGNQLTNAGNDISVILTNGPVSDNGGIFNTVLNIWNNQTHQYKTYVYYTDQDAADNFGTGFGNGWYDGTGAIIHSNLNQGAGAFVYNPRSTNITLTLVGQVVQGSYSLPIATGYSALSIVPPISTNLSVLNFPGSSDNAGINNDVYNRWDPSIQNYRSLTYYTDQDAADNFGTGLGNGWYDGTGARPENSPLYLPRVGEAFFLARFSAGTSNWVYSFTVQ